MIAGTPERCVVVRGTLEQVEAAERMLAELLLEAARNGQLPSEPQHPHPHPNPHANQVAFITQPLAADQALSCHVASAPFEQAQWHFLGSVTNELPSIVFKTRCAAVVVVAGVGAE